MHRIVVGIDGSEGSARALAWAVEEAACRGARIEAVHVWHAPYVEPFPFVGGAVDPALLEAAAKAVVDDAVAAVPNPSGVAIDEVTVCGSAASALVEAARGAELLVVGSRGRGGFAGLLLGSVGQQVTHHTPCPVVVVPPAD